MSVKFMQGTYPFYSVNKVLHKRILIRSSLSILENLNIFKVGICCMWEMEFGRSPFCGKNIRA